MASAGLGHLRIERRVVAQEIVGRGHLRARVHRTRRQAQVGLCIDRVDHPRRGQHHVERVRHPERGGQAQRHAHMVRVGPHGEVVGRHADHDLGLAPADIAGEAHGLQRADVIGDVAAQCLGDDRVVPARARAVAKAAMRAEAGAALPGRRGMARARRALHGLRLRAAGTGARGRDLRTGARVSGSPPALRRGRPEFSAMVGLRVAALATSVAGRAAGRGLTRPEAGWAAAAGAVSSGGRAANASGRAIGVRRLAVSVGGFSASRVSGRQRAGHVRQARQQQLARRRVRGPRRGSGAHRQSRAALQG
jgi:hypothetical protein